MPEENNILRAFDEEGNDIEFEFLGEISYGDSTYVALCPLAEADTDAGEVLLMKVVVENGEEVLDLVEDDLYQEIYEIFKEENADRFNFRD